MIGCLDTTTALIAGGCVASCLVLGAMWGRFLGAPAQGDEDAGQEGADWGGERNNGFHGEGQ